MIKIFLLDLRSDIFQTFIDANQIYSFCNRSMRNLKGKMLIVRNGARGRFYDLTDESPAEIFSLVIKLQNEIR
jgi:hypothetical protein